MRLIDRAATALALALVATGVTACDGAWTSTTPSGASPSLTATDLATDDPAFRLGPDQVPSIAGLDADEAADLLGSHGYLVRIDRRPGCATAQDELAVEPRTGTILPPGSSVALSEVVAPAGADCAEVDHPDRSVVSLLAWARGLGPRPRFEDRVTVEFRTQTASGGDTRTLQGAALADREDWPGLGSLADVLAVPARDGEELVPLVVTRDSSCSSASAPSCALMRGAVIGGSATYTNHRVDTAGLFTVALWVDHRGRVGRVLLSDERVPAAVDAPDVVGDSAAFAAARLHAFGFGVTTRRVPGCAQRGEVTGVRSDGTHATIEVSDGTAACAA
ncbi:PASTA domain-containing protein [Nocardioides sp. BP30]|uniref:PASTA domain-containing protein n=1 Tax=Nocardioides sp. BP30 TaxID=3036374 RepID=UPI002468FE4A|nr:PASTA domain-containing protein [Nocardioides sp. BP30]WGL52303.1 PASTA domain-containing protein [Nocardioides sp. BP30]